MTGDISLKPAQHAKGTLKDVMGEIQTISEWGHSLRTWRPGGDRRNFNCPKITQGTITRPEKGWIMTHTTMGGVNGLVGNRK